MIRRVIEINEERCNGCGLCAAACHEGAIGMVDGKARLLRDDYCDGLGDCLPACPVGAISFVEREAAAYDEAAVEENMRNKERSGQVSSAQTITSAEGQERREGAAFRGCPGSMERKIDRKAQEEPREDTGRAAASWLQQWPVQIKLVPVKAPYFDGAHLLIAADCTAYAYGSFHQDFIRGKITLIGCPKLDEGDYAEKLEQILRNNDIRSVTIVRMEVPCCKGLERAAVTAMQNSGKFLPWQVAVISTDGRILD